MSLDRVTITGADDNTSIEELFSLSLEFPFVEFGILVSSSREGSPRYPSRDWCRRLNDKIDGRTRISVHVCGLWAREIFAGTADFRKFPTLYPARMQINGTTATEGFTTRSIDQFPNTQFIIQYPRSQDFLEAARIQGVNIVPLFDESGGEGKRRESWPLPVPDFYCGFAGGIGLDNVATVVRDLSEKCSTQFWIDMEGRVRDEKDRMDLDCVGQILGVCAPLVVA